MEKADLAAEIIRRVGYNADTGILFWRAEPPRGRVIGDALTTHDNGSGYLYAVINRRSYAVHRIALLLLLGRWPDEGDHINGNRKDNREVNLREATRKQNSQNVGKRAGTSSVFKGVNWHKYKRKWRATIHAEGRHISLGYYATEEAASAAYQRAAETIFGQFRRVG